MLKAILAHFSLIIKCKHNGDGLPKNLFGALTLSTLFLSLDTLNNMHSKGSEYCFVLSLCMGMFYCLKRSPLNGLFVMTGLLFAIVEILLKLSGFSVLLIKLIELPLIFFCFKNAWKRQL